MFSSIRKRPLPAGQRARMRGTTFVHRTLTKIRPRYNSCQSLSCWSHNDQQPAIWHLKFASRSQIAHRIISALTTQQVRGQGMTSNKSHPLTGMKRESLLEAFSFRSAPSAPFCLPTPKLPSAHPAPGPPSSLWAVLSGEEICVLLFFLIFINHPETAFLPSGLFLL